MSCISFRKLLNILLLAFVVLWVSTQRPLHGQTGGSGSETLGTFRIFGTVVQQNGTPPPIGTAIEMDCGVTTTRVADVDPKGDYNFQLGDLNRASQIQPDAGVDRSHPLDDPFYQPPSAPQSGSQTQSSSATPSSGTASQSSTQPATVASILNLSITNCELRAYSSGYRSSVLKLEGLVLTQVTKVDPITIYPLDLKTSKKAKKLFDQALKALKKENVKEGESLLKSAVAEYPDYDEAWAQLGTLYQQQKRDAEAGAALKKAISINRFNVAPYVQLGWIAIREGTAKEAESKLKTAECKKKEEESKAKATEAKQKLEESKAKAKEGKQKDAALLLKEAEAKLKESELMFKEADVKWKEAMNNAKEAEGKWKEAADITEKSIKLAPLKVPEAYYLNAIAYFNLKDPVKAEKQARYVVQFDTGHQLPRIHLILAHIMEQNAEYAEAIAEFQNYIRYASTAADVPEIQKQIENCKKKAKGES
jgi:Tfp pilus assembly protein PilF